MCVSLCVCMRTIVCTHTDMCSVRIKFWVHGAFSPHFLFLSTWKTGECRCIRFFNPFFLLQRLPAAKAKNDHETSNCEYEIEEIKLPSRPLSLSLSFCLSLSFSSSLSLSFSLWPHMQFVGISFSFFLSLSLSLSSPSSSLCPSLGFFNNRWLSLSVSISLCLSLSPSLSLSLAFSLSVCF